MKPSILLISNSDVNGNDYLAQYVEPIKQLLTGINYLLYIPYASEEGEWDADTQKARVFFNKFGIAVIGVHQIPDERLFTELKSTNAIFIDGGNPFRLHKELKIRNLLPMIRTSILSGEMKYIGSGAGTNIACKTIHTINDVSAFYPNNGLEGINIFPYYINLESSQQKEEEVNMIIADFHQINKEPVIRLREGSYLSLDLNFAQTGEMYLGGKSGAKIFFKGRKPVEATPAKTFIFSEEGGKKK